MTRQMDSQVSRKFEYVQVSVVSREARPRHIRQIGKWTG